MPQAMRSRRQRCVRRLLCTDQHPGSIPLMLPRDRGLSHDSASVPLANACSPQSKGVGERDRAVSVASQLCQDKCMLSAGARRTAGEAADCAEQRRGRERCCRCCPTVSCAAGCVFCPYCCRPHPNGIFKEVAGESIACCESCAYHTVLKGSCVIFSTWRRGRLEVNRARHWSQVDWGLLQCQRHHRLRRHHPRRPTPQRLVRGRRRRPRPRRGGGYRIHARRRGSGCGGGLAARTGVLVERCSPGRWRHRGPESVGAAPLTQARHVSRRLSTVLLVETLHDGN